MQSAWLGEIFDVRLFLENTSFKIYLLLNSVLLAFQLPFQIFRKYLYRDSLCSWKTSFFLIILIHNIDTVFTSINGNCMQI